MIEEIELGRVLERRERESWSSIRESEDCCLDHDEGETSFELLGLFLDRGDHFLGAIESLLSASLEHELEHGLDTIFRLHCCRAFAISYCSSPLDDLGKLLLVHGTAALVLRGASARVGIAHGVTFAADDVDWRGRAVLLQLANPLALNALERGLAGEVEAHNDGIAAFVGQCAVVCVLLGGRSVLYGDFAMALACLEVGLVEIERIGRVHAVNEDVLCELDGKCGLTAVIVTNEYYSLLCLRGRHLVIELGGVWFFSIKVLAFQLLGFFPKRFRFQVLAQTSAATLFYSLGASHPRGSTDRKIRFIDSWKSSRSLVNREIPVGVFALAG